MKIGFNRENKKPFDRYSKRYDEWYEKNRYAYLSEVAAIKKSLSAKGKGLEIGVGTGRFASQFGVKYGIDSSKKMVAIAKSRGIDAIKGNAEKLPYGNSEFDFALIINTLCFVENPENVIREARRVLKKDGCLVVGIIDRESFLGRFYMEKKSKFYKKAKFYSVKEVADMLGNSAFAKVLVYQTVFDYASKITAVQKPLEGYGKGGFVVCSARKK
ncbi:MAG: class I SAM-dependent methyltransferase [Elusimicrobiota bacterium]